MFKQDKYPEQLYRSCEGVLSLAKKTDSDEFIKALEMAMEYSNYSYVFLKRILENKMVGILMKSLIQHCLNTII